MTSFSRIRREKALTMQEVAERIGVTKGAIWQIETGRINPKVSTLKEMAKVYGCSIDELLQDEPTEEDSNNG